MRYRLPVVVLTVVMFGRAVSAIGEDQAWAGDPYLLASGAVTGEPLAEAESPVVLDVDGRELWFVDQAAAEKFQASPETYFPTIDEAMVQQQLPFYPLENCPISGAKLGSMGEPINVIEGNRLVRLCCAGCTHTFEKDPVRTIQKLDEAVMEAQAGLYENGHCPVSGEALGSMGEPKKVVAGNRLVVLCCSGCVRSFEKNPQKFLSNLPDFAEADVAKPAAAKPHGHGHHD